MLSPHSITYCDSDKRHPSLLWASVHCLLSASRATTLSVAAKPIAAEIARATKHELACLKALPMVWEDFMIKLRATDPQLFDK